MVAWHPRLLILGSIASQYLVCLVANAETRYRVPIIPLMALLAAYFFWGLIDAWWQKSRGDGVGLSQLEDNAAGAAL